MNVNINMLLLSYSNFPLEDASAIRQESFLQIFKELGYNPFVVCMNNNADFMKVMKYKDFNYISLRYSSKKIINKLKNYCQYKRNLKKIISKYGDKIKIIFVEDIPLNAWLYVKKICKKNNICLIHDSVEWYSASEFKLRWLSYLFITKNILNKYIVDKKIKVIAISSYLEKYYKNKNISCIKIPVILDIAEKINKRISAKKVRYIYAGSPGKKDNLDIMLKGFAQLKKRELDKLEIQLYGVKDEQVKKLITTDEYSKIIGSLKCFGRVKHEKILKAYETANYSLLLRNDKLRYSKAGFPTKVVESLMCSTPVITNYTSDLNLYLFNKKNSIIVADYSSLSFCKAIKRSMKISRQVQRKMQDECHKTAVKFFDYRNYIEKIGEFING